MTAETPVAPDPARTSLALFAAAVLLSAALLFVVQPMFARMVLPMMGGTPATWTTCLLFFQLTLLLGYLYVHVTSARLTDRSQGVVHVLLLLAAIAVFPLAAPSTAAPSRDAPAVWLLSTLATCVGLPFLAVSGTAPLLQRWYARASGRDPYFLYAASNLGSLVGLLGYPLIVERSLTLAGQRRAWSTGFALLTVLVGACAATAWRRAGRSAAAEEPAAVPAMPVRAVDRAWWLALALVPSSLLLGVTTHISTDVAAAPLLWVVPLAVYLTTFVAAFASPPPISHRWIARLTPAAILAAVIALVVGTSWWVGLAVHLTAFAVVALACHGELSERRPGAADLTQYFLFIALGGALGGMLNAVVAPAIFSQVVEYPLMLAGAAALRPAPGWRGGRQEPVAAVVGLPLIVFAVLTAVWSTGLATGVGIGANTIGFWLVVAVALAATNRRVAFAVAVACVVVAHLAVPRETGGRVIFAARSFFGVHRVIEVDNRTIHRLTHGTTLHGWERVGAGRCEPTSYYHPDGPIGQLFRERRVGGGNVAVIGLGAGGLVCYAPAGGRWTFLEIDPLVERIARNPALFTFLQRASGAVQVVIGDGRIRLGEIAPGALDTLVVDAFSSDAVPVHLLTREFVRLGLERIRPDGHLVFHVSNRYLDLAPVVAAAAVSLGAAALEQAYETTNPDAVPSRWLVVARPAALAALAGDSRWRTPPTDGRMWTDDFSNILDVVSWQSRPAAPR